MKARAVEGLDLGDSLRVNASRIVRTRLEELFFLSEPALQPDEVKAQHDMRIAAKRLRYVLEIVGPCFGPPADSARAAARDVQQVLGDVHDCDVMLPLAAGIGSLEKLLRERRAEEYARFRALWAAQSAADTWASLKRAL